MNSFSLDMAKTNPKEITQWLKNLNYILYFFEENKLKPFNEEILFNGKFAQGNHIAFLFELFAIPD